MKGSNGKGRWEGTKIGNTATVILNKMDST